MEDLEKAQGHYSQELNIQHEKVGALTAQVMWFAHNEQCGTEITIWKTGNSHTYDKEVFKGTLAELIAKLS